MGTASGLYDAIASKITASTALPVAFYGVDFTPPSSGMYLQLLPFFNDNLDHFDFATGRGFFRINIVSKVNTGIIPQLELAKEIASWFPMGSEWGGAVITRSGSIGTPIQKDDKMILAVTFRWAIPRIN